MSELFNTAQRFCTDDRAGERLQLLQLLHAIVHPEERLLKHAGQLTDYPDIGTPSRDGIEVCNVERIERVETQQGGDHRFRLARLAERCAGWQIALPLSFDCADNDAIHQVYDWYELHLNG